MKKVLLALAMVAFLAASAQAFNDWTGSSVWTWTKKNGPTVPVKMKIVRWADITYCPDQPQEIVLIETDSDGVGTFEGCVCLKLCVNFSGLKIKAQYNHTGAALLTDGKKYVSLVKAGDAKSWSENSKEITWNDIQLSNNLGTLELCVKLTKVDPQGVAYTGANQVVQVGNVTITMWPSSTTP